MAACRNKMPWPGYIKEAVGDLKKQGDSKIGSLIFKFMNKWQHPNAVDHEPMAADLIKYIRDNQLL